MAYRSKKIVDISELFGVDCNYLLKDKATCSTYEQSSNNADFIDNLKICHEIACRKAELFSAMCDNRIKLDEVVTIIRQAKSRSEAENTMMEQYDISESVAKGILDIRMPELTVNAKDALRYYREVVKQLALLLDAAAILQQQ